MGGCESSEAAAVGKARSFRRNQGESFTVLDLDQGPCLEATTQAAEEALAEASTSRNMERETESPVSTLPHPGRQIHAPQDRISTGIETRLARNFTGIEEVKSNISTDDLFEDEDDLLDSGDEQHFITFGSYNEQTEAYKEMMQTESMQSTRQRSAAAPGAKEKSEIQGNKQKKRKKKNVKARSKKEDKQEAMMLGLPEAGYCADSSNKDGSGCTAEAAGGFFVSSQNEEKPTLPPGLPPRAPSNRQILSSGRRIVDCTRNDDDDSDYPLPSFQPSGNRRRSSIDTPLGNSEMKIAVQHPTSSQRTSDQSTLSESEKRELEEAEAEELALQRDNAEDPANQCAAEKPRACAFTFVSADSSNSQGTVVTSSNTSQCIKEGRPSKQQHQQPTSVVENRNPLLTRASYFEPDPTSSLSSGGAVVENNRPRSLRDGSVSGPGSSLDQEYTVGPARQFHPPGLDDTPTDTSLRSRAQLFRVTTNGTCTFDFDI